METVDDIYEKLVQAVSNSIETNTWRKAQLHLEVLGTSVDFKGYLNDNERFNAPGGFSLAKSVLNLHSITTEGGNNKWNRAIFTVTPDGKFNMEFIWDQALQDEVDFLAKT
ncbi:hypothetical protein ACTJJ0_32405 [Chitinophaga sp. 22321]|uniref:Uncharacterized protein n=1 Tax=Chitinophaga hostae TaxID=2831022 RepID=A0ABS5J961_9BACT|nr:hypothetical protein [Chitinophaga hostae]MBS0031739.1 hypothetical protein [Chitinophaga hostae]